MALAVKNTPEVAPKQSLNALAVGSLIGTAYVVGSLAIIFYGIPRLWELFVTPGVTAVAGSFLDGALRIVMLIAAAIALVVLGRKLAGSSPPHGLRAGIFCGIFGLLAIGLITRALGGILESGFGQNNVGGLFVMAAAGVALLLAGGMAFFRSGFDRWLVRFEDQGWFSSAAYKKSQGQRVRRGTIIGVLTLIGTGIYTLESHKAISGIGHWQVRIPFMEGKTLILLPDVQFTVPLLLIAAGLWLGYRLVNYPPFADFLIATEAELNKVSWTSRKRLVQDTIVVLSTMLLLTVFLFAMDSLWINVLSWKYVGVLQTDQTERVEKPGTPDW